MSPKDVEATNLQNDAELGSPTAPGYSVVPEQPTDDSAPPSYDSLFKVEIHQVKTAKDYFHWFQRFILWIFGTVWFLIALGLSHIILLSMVIIGILYIHDCTAQKWIPIYLIVTGAAGLLKVLMSAYYHWKYWKTNEAKPESVKPNPFDGLLSLFFVWLVHRGLHLGLWDPYAGISR